MQTLGYPQLPLRRGDVYKILFPQTDDPKYPKGKPKHALVLQSGPYFSAYVSVCIALLTSEIPSRTYPTDVLIPAKTISGLDLDTIVTCGLVYTVPKSCFENQPFTGRIPDEYMKQIDEALMIGLQIVDMLKP